jgi:hypothetical protein
VLLSLGSSGIAMPNHVAIATNESATPLASGGPTGYQPLQLAQAYGFNQTSYNGSGTTIAIVDSYDDPNIVNDLKAFNTQFNLPQLTASTSPGAGGVATFTVMNQSGGATSQTGGTSSAPPADSTGGWETEEALDVEWAHAMAPGASIVLVEANSDYLSDLFTAVQAANTLGANVVSMSWGGSEFAGENSYDSSFTTPGVVYVNASGDSGAPVGYPGASPDVVAVGGTTLNLTSQNNISSESGWSGSGGGISADEAQPSYQHGIVTQSSSRRTNPDVAYDANPSTGVPVYDSFDTSTAWGQWGGTSIAAPQWAALFAIADQARAAGGQGPLISTQALSLLYATYNSSSYSSDFHDITSGTSTGSPHYTAGTGYDLVTGLGTPNASQLVNVLGGATSSPTTTVTHFAITPTSTGPAGSSFSFTITALNSSNNTVAGYNGTVRVTSTDGQAVLPANPTLSSGMGSFSVTLKTAGSQTVAATDTVNSALTGSATVSVSPAGASKLAFLQQPTNVMVGATITPAVTVAIEDLYSNVITTDNSDSVTLAIGPNSGSGTLGGAATGVLVNGGVASFSNLTISGSGAYTLVATATLNSGPASVTSTSFNATTAAPQPAGTIEGFESGNLSSYTLQGPAPAPFSVSTAAEHNGTYGLVATGGSDWIYRNDPAVQVQPGETLSVWLQFQGSASGAAYFGFASNSSRTLSFVVSPATNQLLIELNANRVTVLGSIRTPSSTWKANSWYRLEVDWGTNNAIVGKLYDSSGTNLLASLTSAYTVTGSGGIAFSATGAGSKYFDTVQMVPAGTAISIHALPSLTQGSLVLGNSSAVTSPQIGLTPPPIVISVPAGTPAGQQVLVIAVPVVTAAPSALAPVPSTGANLGTNAALVSPLATIVPARPVQPLLGPSQRVERILASPDPAPEDRLPPDLEPLFAPAIETSVPLPAGGLEAPAVPLSLLRTWDSAITAFAAGEVERVLSPAPVSRPTGTGSDHVRSALESTLVAGAAVFIAMKGVTRAALEAVVTGRKDRDNLPL